ncbi:protein LATERAL ROOT PRIMORDIUM 1-like [Bidens hawaiensis]|uniref:protein LATERAL ROOT PRIMORDIUM 1-like n=1 Tax=Bidens hawaiensis TaxID=980011 RepID=UPI00404A6803
MWPASSSTSARQINYGIPEIGMLGLRDVVVVTDPHAHHPHSVANATALGVGVGVIPLLTATPCLEDNILSARGSGGGRASNTNSNYSIQFWQNQPQSQPHNYLSKPMISDHGFLQASVGGGGSTSTSGSTMTCQDCGNQAKKDCSHRRCRTCCKSRGFDCATHIKSTWVPAARRRERQLMTSTGAASVSSASTSGPKKPRLTPNTTTTSHTSTSNTTPPRSFDTSSSHHKQDASFKESLPGQVRAPAVFKCVRVTAVDDGDDEYAYQASATIGGHVFKGFLYDQGVETRDHTSFPNFSELHLGASTGGGRNLGGGSSSPLLDASDVFGSSGGGLLAGGGGGGGSSYGNITQ